jgi:hypothetical protein
MIRSLGDLRPLAFAEARRFSRMVNHPNRNRALKTEVNGVRFKLSFDAAGNPYVLK